MSEGAFRTDASPLEAADLPSEMWMSAIKSRLYWIGGRNRLPASSAGVEGFTLRCRKGRRSLQAEVEISWTSPRRSSKLRFSRSESSLLIKYLPHNLMPKQLHVPERRLPVSLKSKSSPWWSRRRGFKSLENPDPPVWRQRNRRTQIRHSQSHSRKEKLPQLAISKAAFCPPR